MTSLLGIWLFLLLLVMGIGQSTVYLISNKRIDTDCFKNFWLGIVVIIFALQIIQIFIPVNGVCFYGFGVVSLIGYYLLMKERGIQFLKISPPVLVFTILISLWLANRALSPNLNEDTGLYHLGIAKWLSEYPIIPGLGNVHGRLAFNNSSLLFSAFIDAGFWSISSVRIGNSLLILVAFVQMFSIFFQSKQTEENSDSFKRFYAIVSLPVLFFIAFSAIGLDTDIPVIILGIVVGLYFIDMIMRESNSFLDYFSLIFICSVGFTLKLSFGFFCFCLCLVSIFTGLRKSVFNFLSIRLAILVSIAILVILPFFIRGYITSGYPLFPSTIGGIGVDWAVAVEEADQQAYAIKSFARDPQYRLINKPEDMVFSNWIFPWIKFQLIGLKEKWMVSIPFALGSLALLLQLVLKIFDFRKNLYWLLPFVCSLVFWFGVAPSPRFAGALFWFYFVLSVYPLIKLISDRHWFKFLLDWKFGFLGVFSVMFLIGLAGKRESVITDSPSFIQRWPLPLVDYESVSIPYKYYDNGKSSSITLQLSKSRLPWNIPLPSAPSQNKNLRLRGFEIQQGFIDLRSIDQLEDRK